MALLIAATIVLVLVLLAVNRFLDPSRTPQTRRVRDIHADIDILESRAAALEAQLDELPAEEDDSTALDWAADGHGPSFQFGKADIPVVIEYRSGNGCETAREITVEQYRYKDDRGTLSAYCHMRGARRTFVFSRILSATDPETGERIESLGPWLDARYLETPQAKASQCLDAHFDAIEALFYIAKADGAFRAREKEILRQFLVEQDVPLASAAVIVADVAKWVTPSAVAYGKRIRALATTPGEYRRAILRSAQAIIGSNKEATPKEVRAIQRLKAEIEK